MGRSGIVIDETLCTGCGICVKVCPSATISIEEGKAIVSGDDSIGCGHCEAACPAHAIRVGVIDSSLASFDTLSRSGEWLAPGEYDTSSLIRLMASRRSCRNFSDRPVDRRMLRDLVKIGVTAPSGTSSQSWTFTIVPSRQALLVVGARVVSYYERLNVLAEKALLRSLLKFLGKGELEAYYRNYYEKVRKAIEEWHESGKDRLFHGAAAVIIVGSRPGASCPVEDALLATQNILLAAHAMGLGSCLIGFAVEAMRRDLSIQDSIGIPREEAVHSVIALGYPDEIYQRAAGRKSVVHRYFEG